MKKTKNIVPLIYSLFFLVFLAFSYPTPGSAITGPPHIEANGVECAGCHDEILFKTNPEGQDPAARQCMYENVCLHCHYSVAPPYHGENAPMVKGHHAPGFEGMCDPEAPPEDWYGMPRCTDCHQPHTQPQFYDGRKYYPAVFEIAVGTKTAYRTLNLPADDDLEGVEVTEIDYANLTLKSGWSIDDLAAKTSEGRGMQMLPNRSNAYYSAMIYKVSDDATTSSGTITVKGAIVPGSTFSIAYGQSIYQDPPFLDDENGIYQGVPVTFLDKTSDGSQYYNSSSRKYYYNEHSFAHNDGKAGGNDSTPNGICQVCHTQTNHWRKDGSRTEDHYSGANCTSKCHQHTNGFFHSSGPASLCIECHGHDEGTVYGASPAWPYIPNGEGAESIGAGSFWSHSTHTENDEDDRMGPTRSNGPIYCDTCHDTENMPNFKDGYGLEDTHVCDNCHSPGGTYDGVADPVIGAKANWSSGIYNSDRTLQTGKERWCVACHDEEPGNSRDNGTGVNAPNIAGGESEDYTYGTGWGFYKTGHGLASDETYPSKGGIETLAGRPVECSVCHDLRAVHIDNAARTFDCSDGCNASEYRQGYRLNLVNGEEPMNVPRPWASSNNNGTQHYRLCVNCHDSGPFIDSGNMNTNMRKSGTNYHEYHLGSGMHVTEYPADYDPDRYASSSWNSQVNCVICHNVHGSTQLAMVRDGMLINREPGLRMWYTKSGISVTSTTADPQPEDIPLSLSDGKFWWGYSSGNLCGNCHGGSRTGTRDPYQETAQAPTLDWTGENGYLSDGADPDSGPSGGPFYFRVKYTDVNNDSPAIIQLWIDLNDDGDYEDVGEKIGLGGSNTGDNWYYDGKIFTTALFVSSAGDDIISYRFHAVEDTTDAFEATGPATGESTISLLAPENHPPELEWVDYDTCGDKGVNPSAGVEPFNVDFSVVYKDADNNPPDSIQVWVDLNDDGDFDDIVDAQDERQDLIKIGAGTDYINGESYAVSFTLNYYNDGVINYRFVASDGTDDATGEPTYDHTVTVIDNSSGTIRTVTCVDISPADGICDCVDADPVDGLCDDPVIQPEVSASTAGDTVLVQPGTYTEQVSFNAGQNNISVRSICGPAFTTIQGTGTVVSYSSSFGMTAVLDGFQITGGTRGVSISKAYPVINNCWIHDNINTAGSGCGIAVGDPVGGCPEIVGSRIYNNDCGSGAGFSAGSYDCVDFSNTEIYDNDASGSGGGGSFDGPVTFTDCIIRDNTAGSDGGGILHAPGNSSLEIVRSAIIGNTAGANGGGIRQNGGPVTMENTILARNQAQQGGGAYYKGSLVANFSTIADNEATAGHGGAVYSDNGSITFKNSIVWSNRASSGTGHIAYFVNGGANISDTILSNDSDTELDDFPYFGGSEKPSLIGVVDDDPLFVDPENRNYHLREVSPAIDYVETPIDPLSTDIDGDSRPQGASYDIGADEYVTAAPVGTTTTLSWTGEPGYENDGVDPDSAVGETGFTFRIEYADLKGVKGTPPVFIQVWIDENDDGAYSSGEKHDLDSVDGDDDYTDGKWYTLTYSIPLAGDGNINYRFYATSGTDEATGDPTANHTVKVTNNPPKLSWSPDAGYGTDGVNPNSGAGGTIFEFRVVYADVENTAPSIMQAWVDVNDSGTYESNEKYDMSQIGSGSDFKNGVGFTKALTLYYLGDGVYSYRFYAKDNVASATGPPVSDKTFTVINNVPTLSWIPDAGYIDDGVDPDSGPDGSSFVFRVDYTDIDNNAPTVMQVWVDVNDSGTYESGEKYNMEPAVIGDTTYNDGKRYTKTMILAYVDGSPLNYRFAAADSAGIATGAPTSDSQLIVEFSTNEAPVLAWTGELDDSVFPNADYTVDGVHPDRGGGGTPFTFRVKYSDANDDPPDYVRLYIDRNDDAVFTDSGDPAVDEIIEMAIDGGDGNYQNGENYTVSLTLTHQGDGGLAYHFEANDGTASATAGAPFNLGGIVTVVDALLVPSEYATIQAAINAASADDIVLVDAATYSANENINFLGKRILVQSENGTATITGSGSNNPVVTFATGETSATVLDGFTINNVDSGTYYEMRGVKISNGSAPTIRNSDITGNNMRGKGAGILVDGGAATIENCNIDSNSTSYEQGAGLYLINGSGATTITDSSISSNTAKVQGGGLYVSNSAIELNNVTVDNNRSNESAGGGAYFTGDTDVAISGGSISGNWSKSDGGGVYFNGGGAGSLSISGATIGSNATGSGGSRNGGGLYLESIGTTTTISNTSISSNTAGSGWGGGVYATGAPLELTGVTIDNCSCYGDGGGLWTNSSMTVTDSVISNNRTTHTPEDGGGIYANGASIILNFTNTTIAGNTSNTGGGIAAYVQELYFTGGSISGNTASGQYHGGGLRCSGDVSIYGTYIQGNICGYSGAGVYHAGSGSLTVTNVIITGNQGGTYTFARGGGINSESANTMIMNCTVTANFAKDHGGISVAGGTVINSIVWNNFISGGSVQNVSGATVLFSDISGSGYTNGGNNIDATPQFVVPSSAYPSTAGDFHLCNGADDPEDSCTAHSPCIDAATKTNAPDDDIDGDDRTGEASYDMGADEYFPPVAVNSTTAGTATAAAAATSSILFSMPYTDDDNGNNTYVVEYKLSSSGTWLAWETNPKDHSDSPYSDTIGGLTPGETYDVRLTYNDADGVNGTNPQIISNISLPVQIISGTVYTDEGTSTIADGATVRLLVNGVSIGTDTTEGGAYSITADVSVGDAILVYIDGAGTDGTTVSVSDGSSDLSGIDIYGGRLITRHDNGGGLTNVDMYDAIGTYSDSEILYSVVPPAPLSMITNAAELYVPVGHTYAPGGDITAAGVDINGTLDAAANSINVSGDWDATGGVFISTGTVTFNAADGMVTITPGGTDDSHDFGFIEFNDGGGSAIFQLGGDLDVNSNLVVTDGTFDTGSGSNYNITVGGHFTDTAAGRVIGNWQSLFTVGGNFTLDLNNSTTERTDMGYANITLTGGGTVTINNVSEPWTYGIYKLTGGQGGNTTNIVSNTGFAVRNLLTVGSGTVTGSVTLYFLYDATLSFDTASILSVSNINFHSYDLSANLPPLSNGYDTNLRLTGISTTVNQTGNVVINAPHNLIIDGSGNTGRTCTFNTNGYSLTVGGDLVIGFGGDDTPKTLNAADSTVTVGGNLTVYDQDNAVFTTTGSTVVLDGTGQAVNGSIIFNNLAKTVASADTLTFESGKTTTINGTVTLKGASGQLLSLASSTGSSAWNFNVGSGATKDIDYVSVSWSDASGSDATQKPIAPTNSLDGGNNIDWFGGGNNPPETPVNSNYISGETGVSATPTLNASAFSDPDGGDTHQASQFVVDDSSDCASPVYDSGTLGAVTSHTVGTALANNTLYYWCVRYQDSNDAWSSYSAPGTGFTTEAASGTTFTVCASGCDFTSIKTALDTTVANEPYYVESGDTVLVTAGTSGSPIIYSENINFNGKNVTVTTTDTAHPEYTKIQGDGSNAPVVNFSGGETSSAVLDGFLIDNQRDDYAAIDTQYARGIYIISGSSPTVKNCKIEGNKNESWNTGAGIYINGNNGGGIIIEDTDIGASGNTNFCQYGAGLYATATTSPGNIVISNNSTISYNVASQWGAGLYISGMNLTLSNSVISDNNSQSGNDNYSGGGMLLLVPDNQSMTVGITECIINSNKALNAAESGGGKGGGIAASTGATNSNMTLNITKSELRGNHSWLDGGGIYINSGGVVATVTNSIITGNSVKASWEYGGGISNYATVNIYNSTIAGNYAGSQGGGLHAGGNDTIRNSIIWGNTSGSSNPNVSGAAETVWYSDVEAYTGGTGNIGDDPLNDNPDFIEFDPAGKATSTTPTTGGNFHLLNTSPCIDTASSTNAPGDDIDGGTRYYGSGYDMGADEYGVP